MLSWKNWRISVIAALGLSFFAGLKLHDGVSHMLHPDPAPTVYGFKVDFLNNFLQKGR